MAKKWLKYPNGAEVVVKASDAEAHRDRIIGELVRAGVKNPAIEILDKPTEGAPHSDRESAKPAHAISRPEPKKAKAA